MGYARVSTEEQNLDAQVSALVRAGVHPDDIWREKVSGRADKRPEFARLLKAVQSGDVLVVWKLDRIARSMRGVLEVVKYLQDRGATFRSLTEQIDLTTPAGTFMLHVMAAMAQFEVDMIRERTRAGLEEARDQGRIGGRRQSYKDEQIAAARDLLRGGATYAEAAATVKNKHGKTITVVQLRTRIRGLEKAEVEQAGVSHPEANRPAGTKGKGAKATTSRRSRRTPRG